MAHTMQPYNVGARVSAGPIVQSNVVFDRTTNQPRGFGFVRFEQAPALVQCSAVQCSAVQCSAGQCSAVQCRAGRAGYSRLRTAEYLKALLVACAPACCAHSAAAAAQADHARTAVAALHNKPHLGRTLTVRAHAIATGCTGTHVLHGGREAAAADSQLAS